MLTLSNALSLLRAPLAFLFLLENFYVRLSALALAMITDAMDGYFARKQHSISKFGVILDPVMDKFFVYFALFIFLHENKLRFWQALTMFSRDFALCVYGFIQLYKKKWKEIRWQSIRFGKITTALQFCVLIGLSFNYAIPFFVYGFFILLGIFAFLELLTLKSEH